MKLPAKQQGVGLAGWLILIMLFGGALTIGTKLFPLYMDHNTMSNILDKLAEEDGMSGKSKREVQEILTKRFKLNNIRDFDLKNNIVIERTANGTRLVMAYEARVPFIGNVDMVASFRKEIELRN